MSVNGHAKLAPPQRFGHTSGGSGSEARLSVIPAMFQTLPAYTICPLADFLARLTQYMSLTWPSHFHCSLLLDVFVCLCAHVLLYRLPHSVKLRVTGQCVIYL